MLIYLRSIFKDAAKFGWGYCHKRYHSQISLILMADCGDPLLFPLHLGRLDGTQHGLLTHCIDESNSFDILLWFVVYPSPMCNGCLIRSMIRDLTLNLVVLPYLILVYLSPFHVMMCKIASLNFSMGSVMHGSIQSCGKSIFSLT